MKLNHVSMILKWIWISSILQEPWNPYSKGVDKGVNFVPDLEWVFRLQRFQAWVQLTALSSIYNVLLHFNFCKQFHLTVWTLYRLSAGIEPKHIAKYNQHEHKAYTILYYNLQTHFQNIVLKELLCILM